MNVFNFRDEHYEIMSLLEEMEGEITPELQERYDQFMIAGEDKLKDLYWVYKWLQANHVTIENEIKRIEGLKKSNASQMDRIKTTMDFIMKSIKLEKLKEGTINIVLGKHTEFSYEEEKVPRAYFEEQTTTKFKLAEFKAWCKDNKEAAEKLCGAKFVEGKRIQIK